MNQCSIYLTQLWRGNKDIKVLIHNSDPHQLFPIEISGVCDNIVSHISKCSETLTVERENMKDLILRTEDISGDKHGLFRIAR
jgi:hypothetical protein